MAAMFLRNRRLVPWVRFTYRAIGVALALSFLSFICVASGGGEGWRILGRICVGFGVLATLILVISQVAGVRMLEDTANKK
jgi:hypothetical protein